MLRKISHGFSVFVLFLAQGFAWAAVVPVEMRMLPSVTVLQGNELTVADIVVSVKEVGRLHSATGAEESNVAMLAGMNIPSKLADDGIVSREELLDLVVSAGVPRESVAVLGRETLVRHGFAYDRERVNDVARQYMLSELQNWGAANVRLVDDSSLEINRLSFNPVDVPDRLYIPSWRGASVPAKRERIDVSVVDKDSNKLLTVVPVWFAVEVFSEVMVAVRDVTADSIITRADFVKESRNIAGFSSIPLLWDSDMEALHSQKIISKGQPLLADMASKRLPVKVGDTVLVEKKVGEVTVISRAVARDSGEIGQSVRLKPTGVCRASTCRGDNFLARVTGDRYAAMED